MLARMTPLKGVDRAIKLARQLGQHLVLIGDGPARHAQEGECPDDVEFLGSLDRDAAMLRLAHAQAMLLLPRTETDGSGAEGLGLCLLEAAARGVPVIGCATGGVPEATGPGLLIDPDAPDLQAIREFLGDPEAGLRAQAWVQQAHGPEACLHVLREALG
jgi:glycosyltransferase involved in cell wall biosynthesis